MLPNCINGVQPRLTSPPWLFFLTYPALSPAFRVRSLTIILKSSTWLLSTHSGIDRTRNKFPMATEPRGIILGTGFRNKVKVDVVRALRGK